MTSFAHLRVASGYSLQYGASQPGDLVAAAAAHGQEICALTDRDGLYGAVRFAKACLATGVRPVIGVDLAVDFHHRDLDPDRDHGDPRVAGARAAASRRSGGAMSREATGWSGDSTGRPRLPQAAAARASPVRGGTVREPARPRVVVLARSRAGWAALCRLVSAVHLTGQRSVPVASFDQVVTAASTGEVVVMLGADSELGWAIAAGRSDLAGAELRRWREAVPDSALVLAATCHDVGGDGQLSELHAARTVALADSEAVPVVLTHAVRMAERGQAATVDVLDASRRLVPLGLRHLERRNAEGYLKDTPAMAQLADRVAARAGRGPGGGARLLADTMDLAGRCALDPKADIGLGEIHLPEAEVLGIAPGSGDAVLRARCEAGISARYGAPGDEITTRLDEELDVISRMGFATYFLTVGDVTGMIRDMGVRCAARGSGAGSLVNYLLGISGVDPLRYGLIMERFLSPLRVALPDIDIDVESARRTDVYRRILEAFGGERVACVMMMDTYRVRHAVRDVGAALSLPPGEIDAIAKAFPHIRARDARAALRDLPELRAAGLGEKRLEVLFDLVESLDGLPRHVALHPCGVLLSDVTLLERTPVEASFAGFPMSQFDKDDVEDLGLLKLDVLGIRMQSAMTHAIAEISRTEGVRVDIDALAPYDDPATYDLISHAQTLGCFQIESPGQRELVAKFGPSTFEDIIVDISLFRPGPVKSDMVTPFLQARQGWTTPVFPHPDLVEALAESCGVVVFHEQIIKIVAVMTGCSLAQGDEARRGLGDTQGQAQVKTWFIPAALRRGYDLDLVRTVWQTLESFASFGFCKAHAAAFALPTYQSAWLKTHYPAHFLAGILTHDPGMYPKRLLLEEARRCQVTILGLDVNASDDTYRVERVPSLELQAEGGCGPGRSDGRLPLPFTRPEPGEGLPDGRAWGIRLSLADVAGISDAEIARITACRPFTSLSDFMERAQASQPVAERLVLAGGFDILYGIGTAAPVRQRGARTRRDLLLALADLERLRRADVRASRARGLRGGRTPVATTDTVDLARRQAATPTAPRQPEVQPAFDFSDSDQLIASGLPELTESERLTAELEILGLDASVHVIERYLPLMTALGVVPAKDLLQQRNGAEILVGGVKVATQTPAVRSGRRVIFLTVDDTTGLSDATFFEDVQGPYAATVFSSWLMVVRGIMKRTGPRGRSLRATGCWDLVTLQQRWDDALTATGSADAALAAVREVLDTVPVGYSLVGELMEDPDAGRARAPEETDTGAEPRSRAGGMGRRRVLVHASGFTQSPYSDVKPAGLSPADAPRKLWHSSPGSSGQ